MIKRALFFLAVFMSANNLTAAPLSVPSFLSYQGRLIDEGGNILPDGETNIIFRILDDSGNILYEEIQGVEIISGDASAVVGNGLDIENGSPIGGIPEEVLTPVATRFLQVEVEGQVPYDQMEIVSAPYAVWSGTALRLPNEAITSAMVGKGVIQKDHLDDELIDAIFTNGIPKSMLPDDTVYSSDLKGFQDVMQGAEGASKVGVITGLVYSGSQTVQGVLTDLDLAIKGRQEEINTSKEDYTAKVDGEKSERISGDSVLQTNITNEENARIGAVNTLQSNINSETNARVEADTTLKTDITNETSARIGAVNTLQSNINSETDARIGAVNALQININNEVNSRTQADATLKTDITNETSARVAGVAALQSNINNEIANRTSADDELQEDIDEHKSLKAAHGVSGTIVGTSSSQTLSNKILNAPGIAGDMIFSNPNDVETILLQPGEVNNSFGSIILKDSSGVTGVTLSAGEPDKKGYVEAGRITLSGGTAIGTPMAATLYNKNIISAWGSIEEDGHVLDNFNVQDASYSSETDRMTVTFHNCFKNNNYAVITTPERTSSYPDDPAVFATVYTKSTCSFKVRLSKCHDECQEKIPYPFSFIAVGEL